MMQQPEEILKQYWGYDNFRPLQKDIILSILNGKDTLAILPTGGGKSICFQVPALAMEGLCIVISPLIALMRDQVDNLKKRGIPALMIHSGMKRPDVIRTLKNATDPYFRFLYVSPERLETGLFREYLPSMNISFIAVDEAHCISQWGYDFRPSYLRIAALRKELPGIAILALTASATPEVQEDICTRLEFSNQNLFRQSFERKNLSYSVFEVPARTPKLLEIFFNVPGTGIVYCKSRKRTVDIAEALRMNGQSAAHYHAGLSAEERNSRQQAWIGNTTRIMACTNAFGMGIDKPDVRTVVHIDSPDCLENYYQEAGRAGRDGKTAYAVLLYDENDIKDLELQHLTRFPSFEQIRQVYEAMVNYLQIPVYTGQDQSFLFHIEKFTKNFGLQPAETLNAIKALEQDGWFSYNEKDFTPSTLVFTAGRKSLEDFYQSHPENELLLTTLLRTYEGIMTYPSFISESFLARTLKTTEEAIAKSLKEAARFGIVSYVPHSPDPKITFLKNRVKADELMFNHEQYNRRREVYIERVKAMIRYIRTTGCRSRFINQYFGDNSAKDCGICDNCRKNKSKLLSAEEFDKLSSVILDIITQKKPSPEELLQALKRVNREKVWQVLDFLQSQNRVVEKAGKLQLANN